MKLRTELCLCAALERTWDLKRLKSNMVCFQWLGHCGVYECTMWSNQKQKHTFWGCCRTCRGLPAWARNRRRPGRRLWSAGCCWQLNVADWPNPQGPGVQVSSTDYLDTHTHKKNSTYPWIILHHLFLDVCEDARKSDSKFWEEYLSHRPDGGSANSPGQQRPAVGSGGWCFLTESDQPVRSCWQSRSLPPPR